MTLYQSSMQLDSQRSMIILAKSFVRMSLIYIVDRFSPIRKYLKPENMNVNVSADEIATMVANNKINHGRSRSLPMVIIKNMAIEVLVENLSALALNVPSNDIQPVKSKPTDQRKIPFKDDDSNETDENLQPIDGTAAKEDDLPFAHIALEDASENHTTPGSIQNSTVNMKRSYDVSNESHVRTEAFSNGGIFRSSYNPISLEPPNKISKLNEESDEDSNETEEGDEEEAVKEETVKGILKNASLDYTYGASDIPFGNSPGLIDYSDESSLSEDYSSGTSESSENELPPTVPSIIQNPDKDEEKNNGHPPPPEGEVASFFDNNIKKDEKNNGHPPPPEGEVASVFEIELNDEEKNKNDDAVALLDSEFKSEIYFPDIKSNNKKLDVRQFIITDDMINPNIKAQVEMIAGEIRLDM